MTTIFERIRHHWADPDSPHQQIAVGFFWVSLFVLLSKVVGTAKEMVIAWRYGLSQTVDAYLLVFNLINWPVSIWLSVMSVVLIPLFLRLREEGNDRVQTFRAELYGLAVVLGLVLAIGMGVLLSQTSFLAWAGDLAPSSNSIATSMVWPLALSIPFALCSSLLATETMMRQRHGNTLIEGVPSLIIGLSILIVGSWPVAALSGGTLAGFFAQCIVMLLYLRRFDPLPRLRFSFASSAWQIFRAAAVIVVVAQVFQTLTALTDTFWAVRMGEGALSSMGYTNRLLTLLLSLGATAISRAMLPVLSASAQTHQTQTLPYRLARQWSSMLFALGIAFAIISWLLAPLAVHLLFERGAFGAEDTMRVVELLRWGLLQLPFYFAGLVWVSLFTATRSYRVLLVISAGNLAVKLIANEVASRTFGVEGLYLATACMYCFSMIGCWYLASYMWHVSKGTS